MVNKVLYKNGDRHGVSIYSIPFKEARLCSEQSCNVVFKGEICPKCTGKHSFLLANLLKERRKNE